MKFTYRTYPPTAHYPHAIYRPVVPLLLRGPKVAIRWLALVDTGSDFTLLPRQLAGALGINLDYQRLVQMTGPENSPFDASPANVDFELRRHGESIRWTGQAYFAETSFALLGNEGFMEFFVVTFDRPCRLFEISRSS